MREEERLMAKLNGAIEYARRAGLWLVAIFLENLRGMHLVQLGYPRVSEVIEVKSEKELEEFLDYVIKVSEGSYAELGAKRALAQLKLSTEGNRALKDYLAYRTMEARTGKHDKKALWERIKALAQVFIELDQLVEKEKRETLWVGIFDFPFPSFYEKKWLVAPSLRTLRNSATSFLAQTSYIRDFYEALGIEMVEDLVSRLRSSLSAFGELPAQSLEEVRTLPHEVPLLGVRFGLVKVGEKYYFGVRGVNDNAVREYAALINRLPEKVGDIYFFGFEKKEDAVYTGRDFLSEVVDKALKEVLREKMREAADNPLKLYSLLTDLHREGVTFGVPAYHELMNWLQSFDASRRLELFEVVNNFMRRFWEANREAGSLGIRGEEVLEALNKWLRLMKKVLEKYGDKVPPDRVLSMIVRRTEQFLSTLHGNGGALFNLTKKGTFDEFFYLIGLHEGVFPTAAERMQLTYQRTGDKKLLAKYLILHAVCSPA